MNCLSTRFGICVGLSAILWGCTPPPPDPMTLDYAVRIRQDGPRRIRKFFQDNPADPNWINIYYMGCEGIMINRYWHVPDSGVGIDADLKERLLKALRDHSEPVREDPPDYCAVALFQDAQIIVSGRNSAIEITMWESGAHVGDHTGFFINKPFFNALEQYLVREKIIPKDKYHWFRRASFRTASGELSLAAPMRGIDSEEALEEAIRKWPPGSLGNPPKEP